MRSCRCGAPLPLQRHQGNPIKWCSQACRIRALRADDGRWTRGESRACLHCAESYQPHRQRQSYCSRQCGWLHRREQAPKDADWLAGRRPERTVKCRDCDAVGVVRASIWLCADCSAKRKRDIWRRVNTKRRGARTTERYTLAEIGDRDGWRCHLCSRRVNRLLAGTHQRGPTIDHLVPISRGGMDEPRNVALAHRQCNSARGTRGTVQLRLVA